MRKRRRTRHCADRAVGRSNFLSGAGRVACTYVRVRHAAFWSAALRENRSGGHRCGSGGGRGIAQTELWAGQILSVA